MFWRCFPTVRGLTVRVAPICAFVLPKRDEAQHLGLACGEPGGAQGRDRDQLAGGLDQQGVRVARVAGRHQLHNGAGPIGALDDQRRGLRLLARRSRDG